MQFTCHFTDKSKFCGSSHILKIDLQSSDSNFFQEMNYGFFTLN
ncbi:hypothetical protein LEP1GSC105_3105 [Leptospira interrogans str. UI 12758]|uniref:Uncharacterized protein n=1 Tax=Leptospira interrogans str. UI 12758 TaxID=1049938 RepID=A0A0E2D3B6_LEPIR|nr:hypothetical protein LEP1GSC105_3105 [Leptospira interrogans str. UI 12758]